MPAFDNLLQVCCSVLPAEYLEKASALRFWPVLLLHFGGKERGGESCLMNRQMRGRKRQEEREQSEILDMSTQKHVLMQGSDSIHTIHHLAKAISRTKFRKKRLQHHAKKNHQ